MRSVALFLIYLYKTCISPFTPCSCRYLPTCSDYAAQAVKEHGAVKGTILATKRFCRCHPWGGHGYDPVPQKEPSSHTPQEE